VFIAGAFLSDFVAHRPGLRIGSLFGRPAAYAGRRVFARVMADGIACRLPRDEVARWIREGARPAAKHPDGDGWVLFRPRSMWEAARLAPAFERAASHVAEMAATNHVRKSRRRRSE
jgi:hypothetical protein